jgi:chromosome partitioning protein
MDKLMENEDTKKILFKTVIRANTTIAESAYVGKPVVFYRSTSFGATDYFNLAKELQQRN